MASREALQKLIQFGNAEQFATHAEDWSACSSAAILNAAVEQLGKLTQQRAYKDNAGTTVQDWNARRTELQESLKLARRRQLSEAREVLVVGLGELHELEGGDFSCTSLWCLAQLERSSEVAGAV